jgi:hypothetical protein
MKKKKKHMLIKKKFISMLMGVMKRGEVVIKNKEITIKKEAR